MAGKIVFLRRTPKEIEMFGGEVYIDIDGKNVGKQDVSNTTYELSSGVHTIKMYKSHTYDTFIGFAETSLTLNDDDHVMIRYSSPMMVNQPGNMMVSDYSTTMAESIIEEKEQKIKADCENDEKIKQKNTKKSKKAWTIVMVIAIIYGVIWGIYCSSIYSLY